MNSKLKLHKQNEESFKKSMHVVKPPLERRKPIWERVPAIEQRLAYVPCDTPSGRLRH